MRYEHCAQPRLCRDRPLRGDEHLARIVAWHEWRKVSASLTLQYDKVLYLLEDRPEHRRLIHRDLEVAEPPDGRIELWAEGAALPYRGHRPNRAKNNAPTDAPLVRPP
ncbi:hypothetical protein MAFF211271_41300 (plasmid) [Ralstonia syzygii subsp. indonesiensis]|nr:hypothetical protein MAFF211271_41300 [Ralstonia pseudosolanacearum]